MATELGKAYVQIVPSAEGIQGKIQNVLNKEAGTAGDSAGDSLGKKLIAGVTSIVAAAGIGKAISSAISAGADLEQLEGGAKLMFGEAYDFIEERAKTAFQNVQMSQNDYLQQVNGFAVGLKTAMGGNVQAAAELADKIVTAEADVVAATGNSQEAVQNAFNGIMKGNFMMLDNLQLGINPTKEGFQEVIDKVNDWRTAQGEAGNLTMDSLADCQQALVDYVEMQGLAGYAANEGATTFSGSLAAMKGAMENLLGDLTLGKDIGPALEGLASTIGDFVFNNALPMLGNLFSSIPDLLVGAMSAISGYSDMIGATALEIVEGLAVGLIKNAPALIEGFAELVTTLAAGVASMDWMSVIDSIMTALNTAFPGGIPQLMASAGVVINGFMDHIRENAASLAAAAPEMISNISQGIMQNLPDIISTAAQVIQSVGEGLIENSVMLLDSGSIIIGEVAGAIMENLPQLAESAGEIVMNLLDLITQGASELMAAGPELMGNLTQGIIDNLPAVVTTAADVVSGLIGFILENAPQMISSGIELIGQLASGILQSLPEVIGAGAQVLADLLADIGAKLPDFLQSGIELLGQLAAGLISGIPEAVGKIPEIFSQIKSAFEGTDWGSIGQNIVDGIANGIAGAASALFESLRNLASNALEAAKSALGIESPSKVFRDEVGKYISLGIGEGIEDYMPTAQLQNSLGQMASQAMPSGGRSVAMGGITFNIYGAGMSTEELTDAIMDKITNALMGGEAAYA